MLLTAAVTVSAAVARADKAPTYAAAIGTSIKDKKLPTTVMHRQVRYLNDVIEGDHGRLKPILGPKDVGFRNKVSAYRMLQGMESMHALCKGQGRCSPSGNRGQMR